MDRGIVIAILTKHTQILAPRWHKYYDVAFHYHGLTLVSFCGRVAHIKYSFNSTTSASICSELEKQWCLLWTMMEQIGVASFAPRSRPGLIISKYPNISHHFTITQYLCGRSGEADYWFTIKIGAYSVEIRRSIEAVMMDELEAQLAVCAALAGSKIPVLIQYEIMAFFFGQN
jgi:hypothetical protein